jgi:hypothetical protein
MSNIPLRHGTVVDIATGSYQRPLDSGSNSIQISKIAREEFNNKPANHAHIKNKSDKLIMVRLDESSDEIYPLDSGENMTINPDDNLTFMDLEIGNTTGGNATGNVYITIGWLY